MASHDANIEQKPSLNQPSVQPTVSEPDVNSSLTDQRARIFKCLEKMQTMLVDREKYRPKDVEACIRLKKMLQLNPKLTVNEIERLEEILEKKIQAELDEIDLKISKEKKSAIMNENVTAMECKCNNDAGPMCDMTKVNRSPNEGKFSNDEVTALERLSIGSASNKQLTTTSNSTNYFENCQNNQQVQSKNSNQQPSTSVKDCPSSQPVVQKTFDHSSMSSSNQGHTSTDPLRPPAHATTFGIVGQFQTQVPGQVGQNIVQVQSPMQVRSQDIVCVGQQGQYTYVVHKDKPQIQDSILNQTKEKPREKQFGVTPAEASPIAPKPNYNVVPKQACFDGSSPSFSFGSESTRLKTCLNATPNAPSVYQTNVIRQQHQKQVGQQQLLSSVVQCQPSIQQEPYQPRMQQPSAAIGSKLLVRDQPQPQQMGSRQIIDLTAEVTSEEKARQAQQIALDAASKWRRDAREALIKSMLQIEQNAYSASQNQDRYIEYFRDIFSYANKSVTRINETEKTQQQVHGLKLRTSLDDLEVLLNNEPPTVVKNVTNEWKKIDSEIDNLMKELSLNNCGVDQPSKSLNLQPDEFEASVNALYDLCRG